MFETIQAVAWPIGLSIVAVSLVMIVFRLTRGGVPRIKLEGPWKSKFEVDYPSEKQPTTAPEIPDQIEGPASTTAQVALPAPEEKPPLHFVVTKDAAELATLFGKFRDDPSYASDPDFWETYYVGRRRKLGVGGTDDEWRNLARDHPTWVWPLIELMRVAVAQGDRALAESYYEQASMRGGPNAGLVLAEGVTLQFRLYGQDAGLEQARRALRSAATDADAAVVLTRLSGELKSESRPLGALIAEEMRIRRDPGNNSRKFDVAYEYGNNTDLVQLAYAHYRDLEVAGYENSNVPNNLGVIFSNLEKLRSAAEQYEVAVKDGSALAACNLAHLLVDAGFAQQATEVLLKVENYDGFEENRATVEQKIHASRRKAQSEIEAFSKLADSSFKLLQQFVTEAQQYWQSEEYYVVAGEYGSVDGPLHVIAKGETAEVSVRVGEKLLSGTLVRSGFILEGHAREKSATMLGGDSRRLALAGNGVDSVMGLVWPSEDQATAIVRLDALRSATIPPDVSDLL